MAQTAERGGLALRGRCLPYGRGHHVLAADRDRPRGSRHRRGRLAGGGAGKIGALVERRRRRRARRRRDRPVRRELPARRALLGRAQAAREPRGGAGRSSSCSRTSTGRRRRCSTCSTTSPRRPPACPLVLICTARPELAERHPDWPEIDGRRRASARPARARPTWAAWSSTCSAAPCPTTALAADRAGRRGQSAVRRAARRRCSSTRARSGSEDDRWVAARDFSAGCRAPGLDRRAARRPPRPPAERRADWSSSRRR